MSAAFGVALLLLLALVLVPAAVLLLQVACALLPRLPDPLPEGARPRTAVLVPAHNEAAGILETLESLLPQRRDADRLVVVADNCSDATARIAAAAGAEVLERNDRALRGKGYALDAGVRCLERDPPAVVVVVDADCKASDGAIDRLARMCAATGRPVQGLYLMKAPRAAGTLAPIAEFAWLVKNLARPLGMLRLGLPCQLMGSGMAFPWAALRSARLASGHIVEDMKLGIDLARAGAAPLFCPGALLSSRFPANAEGTRSQRTRWEHGHLAMIVHEAPRLLLEGLRGARPELLALALDLCVPPLALLTLAACALFAACAAYARVTGFAAPLAVASVILATLAAAVGLAWLRFGRAVVSLPGLLLAATYVLGKLPLYLRFAVRRQVEWVRSRRDVG